MIWLELRKNNRRYNEGWNIIESAWAPTRKEDGAKWPFWYLINEVQKNDIIVHLRHINGVIVFTGYSYASSDSYITDSTPTNDSHEWDFIDSFYKVDLINYHEFNPHILLTDFFHNYDEELIDYFRTNKKRGRNKKRLFYVIQSGRLQCLNGVYFSEFDEKLIDLLASKIESVENRNQQQVITGETFTKFKKRIGHNKFAENVKQNFNYQCCFPNCKIHGRGFLVSGHIARWADNHELRGNTQNGLCFCLLHDKAFEKGHFTLDREFNVKIIEKNIENNQWLKDFLIKENGKQIKKRHLDPMIVALQSHWTRIDIMNKKITVANCIWQAGVRVVLQVKPVLYNHR